MDKNRFDDLAKAMARGASRRDVLRGMLGGVAAGAAITVMPEMVGAQDTCAGSGEACEMVEGSCCEPYTCFEAICDIPRGCVGEGLTCVDDFPCCDDEGLSCVDGFCALAVDAAGDDDDTGGEAATLPSTGVGDGESPSGWLGAVAAGGAVAVAASVLRRNKEQPEERWIS